MYVKCQGCGKKFETSNGLSIHIGKNQDNKHTHLKKNNLLKNNNFEQEIEKLKNEILYKNNYLRTRNETLTVSGLFV